MKIFTFVFLFLYHLSLFAQNRTTLTYQDSVFTVSKDTLLGKIIIDKEYNRYLFNTANGDTSELLPKRIRRFVIYTKESNGESHFYYSFMNEFYYLEFGKNAPITGFAKYTYQPIENDGPKYYIIKKKYCFFKDGAPYFPQPENYKENLLVLTADCPKVANKIQRRVLRIEDIAKYVEEYNHCNGKSK